jgi:predicted nucleotidyltransferase
LGPQGNVESQIEIEKIFFSKHTYKPKGISYIIKKIQNIDFCEKNWLNDPRFDFKSFSNLVEMMEDNLDFERELEEFQDPFE